MYKGNHRGQENGSNHIAMEKINKRVNFTRGGYLYTKNYKTLKKEISRDISCSCIRDSTSQMSVLSKEVRFYTVTIRIRVAFFIETRKNTLKFVDRRDMTFSYFEIDFKAIVIRTIQYDYQNKNKHEPME